MNYKSKYTAALERARELQENSNGMILKKWLWGVFPELKESEDERIRKWLIDWARAVNWSEQFTITKEQVIAWLEKQCEQKPSDKTEPKFKVGDWCIDDEDGIIFQIVKVLDNTYTYRTNEGKEYSCTHYSLENDARLWTIRDAKDGDVLCYETKDDFRIFIYKEGHIHYHCCYSNEHLTPVESFFVLQKHQLCYIHPATKEQCDLLFHKMKEACYEWNSKKKELKKIESKKLDATDVIITEDYCSPEVLKLLREKGFPIGVGSWSKGFVYDSEGYVPGLVKHEDSITHQMAMKWLREVHKIDIVICVSGGTIGWWYHIWEIPTLENKLSHRLLRRGENYPYLSYEEAVEAALKYSLENLI